MGRSAELIGAILDAYNRVIKGGGFCCRTSLHEPWSSIKAVKLVTMIIGYALAAPEVGWVAVPKAEIY